MTDFRDLDPEIRCFALVGQFLQAWSVMENSLRAAIGAALNIETTKLQILCANMRLRDKINILNTLIDVAPDFTDDEKTELRRTFRDLADYSGTRNMMAHDAFHPDDSKTGVEFLTVRAKGKFALPNVVWSVDQFQTEGDKVDQYRDFLDGLEARFRAKPLPQQSYSAALLPFLHPTWPPKGHTWPPTFLDSLSLPPQEPPDSDQANDETNPQIPEKPRG
jgi:hypothetical protein